MGESSAEQWAMLVYRLPREPSTPRIAVWRKLRRYGAFQLTDGVALLPATPRAREQLDWVAEEVVAAGGHAEVWIAAPSGRRHEHQRITTALNAAREREYTDLAAAAHAAARAGEDTARLPALRRRLREITRRDYFSAPGRDAAEAALRGLQDRTTVTGPAARR